jgi:hypothetical protein
MADMKINCPASPKCNAGFLAGRRCKGFEAKELVKSVHAAAWKILHPGA